MYVHHGPFKRVLPGQSHLPGNSGINLGEGRNLSGLGEKFKEQVPKAQEKPMKLYQIVPPYQNTSGRKRILENDPNVTWMFLERYLFANIQPSKEQMSQFNNLLNREKKYL